MDLLSILPGFATKPYAHILPPLERSKITTVDLITLDTLEIAKRAHVPPADVRRLAARIVDALHTDLGFEQTPTGVRTTGEHEPSSSISPDALAIGLGPATRVDVSRWSTISTLDPALDALLGGGIPTGYVTEVTGESGSGKTQFLLSLLLSVQLPRPHGLKRRAIYVSTEHPLATSRLSQLLERHPHLSTLPADRAPSLQNILSITSMDLETQDHILNYQLPVAITRYNVGLVVIDSITSNYRAEHSSNSMLALSARSSELAKLGQLLRNLAVQEGIAIVLANQVSDRFDPVEGSEHDAAPRPGFLNGTAAASAGRGCDTNSPVARARAETAGLTAEQQQSTHTLIPSSSPAIPSSSYPAAEDDQFNGSYLIGNPAHNAILSLLHQERFFTGWGDDPQRDPGPLKTPALGFFWSTQIACRIALKKEEAPTATGAAVIEDHQNVLGDPHPPSESLGPAATESDTDEANPKTSEAEPATSANNHNEPTGPGQNTSSPSPPARSILPSALKPVTRRTMKLVFAPWSSNLNYMRRDETTATTTTQSRRSGEVDFEIWAGGLRSV